MATAAVKKPRTKKAPAVTVEAVPTIAAFKAFDRNLVCNPNGKPFQYEVGKTFVHKGGVGLCDRGFHACEAPLNVLNYYPLNGSRFAKVTLAGKIDRRPDGDSKICGGSITIVAELTIPQFIREAAAWIIGAAKGNTATGYSGHAAATGYSGHAAATGDRGHAAATGDSGIAASLGALGQATAGESGAIMLAYWDTDVWPYELKRVGAFMVGEGGVEAGKTYRLNADGKPEEVA